MAVLKDVLIVHTDDNCINNSIRYYGYSEQFNSVECNEIPPEYYAEIHKNESLKIAKVTWHRRKEYSEQDVKSMLREIKESLTERYKG